MMKNFPMMKSCMSVLVAGMMMSAAPAMAFDGFTMAALSGDAATATASSATPIPEKESLRMSEWVGAPCLSDADCGDLTCDDNKQLCVND